MAIDTSAIRHCSIEQWEFIGFISRHDLVRFQVLQPILGVTFPSAVCKTVDFEKEGR
jgi:hypothetical protein